MPPLAGNILIYLVITMKNPQDFPGQEGGGLLNTAMK